MTHAIHISPRPSNTHDTCVAHLFDPLSRPFTGMTQAIDIMDDIPAVHRQRDLVQAQARALV